MKKAYNNKMKDIFSVILLFVCLFVFNTACGLDIYIVVDEPRSVLHTPYYDSEYADRYFHFRTNENRNNIEVGDKFRGTEIYYKIYNSYSQMSNQVGSINSKINSDDYKADAADQLIMNYKFVPLKAAGYKSTPMITAKAKDSQEIRIRLTDYQDLDAFAADIKIDDKTLVPNENETTKKTQPLRNFDDLNFNFGRHGADEKSRIPEEGDDDVVFSSTTSDDDAHKWYVPLYAVSVALMEDYTYNYSIPLYLGCVTIDDREENN